MFTFHSHSRDCCKLRDRQVRLNISLLSRFPFFYSSFSLYSRLFTRPFLFLFYPSSFHSTDHCRRYLHTLIQSQSMHDVNAVTSFRSRLFRSTPSPSGGHFLLKLGMLQLSFGCSSLMRAFAAALKKFQATVSSNKKKCLRQTFLRARQRVSKREGR